MTIKENENKYKKIVVVKNTRCCHVFTAWEIENSNLSYPEFQRRLFKRFLEDYSE